MWYDSFFSFFLHLLALYCKRFSVSIFCYICEQYCKTEQKITFHFIFSVSILFSDFDIILMEYLFFSLLLYGFFISLYMSIAGNGLMKFFYYGWNVHDLHRTFSSQTGKFFICFMSLFFVECSPFFVFFIARMYVFEDFFYF